MSLTRWIPTSEQDLIDAEGNGILDENIVGVEFKQQLPDNKKTACELASLALHGGALLVGVVDMKHRSEEEGALKPFDLEGIPERIENIASTHRIEAYPRVILANSDATRGYVWVDVPQSPHAPHMVDNRYWGRTGESKYALSDDEVHLYMRRRIEREDVPARELDRFIVKQPSGRFDDDGAEGGLSGLHLVAVPLTAESHLAQGLLAEQGGYAIRDIRAEFTFGDGFLEIGSPSRIADGLAYSGSELSAGQPVYGSPAFEILEVSESGTLRFHHHRVGAQLSGQHYVFPQTIAGNIRVFLEFAGRLSDKVGYLGSWGFALRIDNLSGAKTHLPNAMDTYRLPSYSEAEFGSVSTATTRQLQESPGLPTESLCGQLMRGLGLENWTKLGDFFD